MNFSYNNKIYSNLFNSTVYGHNVAQFCMENSNGKQKESDLILIFTCSLFLDYKTNSNLIKPTKIYKDTQTNKK